MEWKQSKTLPKIDLNMLLLSQDRTSLNAYRGVVVNTNNGMFQAVYNKPSAIGGYRMYKLGEFEDERIAAYYSQKFESDKNLHRPFHDAIIMERDKEFIEQWLYAIDEPPMFNHDSMGYTQSQLFEVLENRQKRCGDKVTDFARNALIKVFKGHNTKLPPAEVVPHMIRAVESVREQDELSWGDAALVIFGCWMERHASAA